MNNDSSTQETEIARAFRLSLPILFAYFPLGMVFGVIFAHSGFAWYLGPFMSAIVYGGSVQFVALSMMTKHASVYAIILSTVFIAFRNSFYGLNFLNRFKTNLFLKGFLIFLLVDATYVILALNPPNTKHNDIKFCLWLSVFIYLYWVIGTLVGGICAGWIPSFPALSFILPAFFMTLVVDYYITKKRWHTIVLPPILIAIAYLITSSQYLLLAIVLSLLSIIVIHWTEKPSHE